MIKQLLNSVIAYFNPPINFGAILSVTLRHVVTTQGQLSRNNPRLRRET